MTKIQQALAELNYKLDTSPSVIISRDGLSITVTNEQFNFQQTKIVTEVACKHGLDTSIAYTDKRPHPAVVITLTVAVPHNHKGQREIDWEQNAFGLTL